MNDDDDDEDDGAKSGNDEIAELSSDEELFNNTVSGDNSGNTDNMFDSLKEDKGSQNSVEKSPEKPKQKRKLGPKMETNASKRPKKKNSYSGSDDDFAASKVRIFIVFFQENVFGIKFWLHLSVGLI